MVDLKYINLLLFSMKYCNHFSAFAQKLGQNSKYSCLIFDSLIQIMLRRCHESLFAFSLVISGKMFDCLCEQKNCFYFQCFE